MNLFCVTVGLALFIAIEMQVVFMIHDDAYERGYDTGRREVAEAILNNKLELPNGFCYTAPLKIPNNAFHQGDKQ